MQFKIDNGIPTLEINDYTLKGWDINSMPPNYNFQNAYVFSNEQDGIDFEHLLFDQIKNLRVEDVPDERIIFMIDDLSLNTGKPQPLELIPYPFTGIEIGVKATNSNERRFFIVFTTIYERDFVDEQWDKKWTMEFYFKQIKQRIEVDQDSSIQVLFTCDDYLSLSAIITDNGSGNVSLAVDKAISRLTKLLNDVEYSLNGLTELSSLIEYWRNNEGNADEEFWRQTFKRFSWVLSVALNEPTFILQEQAYIGGKCLENKQGKVLDFLLKNHLSNNIALIEIKHPLTKLLGTRYRKVYSMSKELTGGMNQLLDYRDTLNKNYYSLSHTSHNIFEVIAPKAYLIIGSLNGMKPEERQSFELFRRHLSGIEIITFDEVFEKLFSVLSILNA